MLKYNNTHIFTGYLKQLLSSFNLPACKIYTHEFAKHFKKYGTEDPRVLESFDVVQSGLPSTRINYLKNDEVFTWFYNDTSTTELYRSSAQNRSWKKVPRLYYDTSRPVLGLTRRLNSPGVNYDTKTHEYLGDYLRFIRDYYNINLMSLYNCFNDKIYNNIYFQFSIHKTSDYEVNALFNAQDPAYRLYAIPVKLFSEYTIAVDCEQGIELFCGLYNTDLDMSDKARNLAMRTYQKVYKPLFKQPFLYKKLNLENWPKENDFNELGGSIKTNEFTRWDLTNREKDLKLFIKVPVSCRSSIAILEGDFRSFNEVIYSPEQDSESELWAWNYKNNHSVLNFNNAKSCDNIDLNNYDFKPISKLQLLEFNTGESYPFADRLIEYLTGSAITQIDEIPDNIKRVQRVMNKNNHYFKIEGLWENKMQNILYDYIMNSGPIDVAQDCSKLIDRHQGNHPRLGHTSKSTLFDVLGYVDKDVEKWYASWKKDKKNDKEIAVVGTGLQSVDIYDGLYDI